MRRIMNGEGRHAAVVSGMILLAVGGCSATGTTPETTPEALVTLAPARAGAVDEELTLYGAVENGSFGRHVLAAPTEAVLVAVLAPVGSAVAAGQPIAQLAASPTAKLDLTKAASDAQAAAAAAARAERLRADGLASDADVETARAAARSSGATRASLAARNAGLLLRAPAAGHVETIGFAAGDLVPAGGAVATLAGSGTLRGRFGVDPAVARRLHAGQAITITTPGATAPVAVAIVSVDPVVDPQTRLASAYVALPAGAGLGAGAVLTGQVALPADAGAAITAPYAALLDDAGQPYVFTVKAGVAHRRDVQIGPVGGDRVAIVKGLTAGEQLVTAGGTALEDGMKVRTR